MKRLALTLAAAAALAGCATTAAIDEAQRSVPTCEAGADCAAKWKAAHRWVAEHAGWPVKTATDTLLQTEGPQRLGGFDTTRLAVTVRLESGGPQYSRIVAEIGCGNPFGCHPEWPAALADFNRTVRAASAP